MKTAIKISFTLFLVFAAAHTISVGQSQVEPGSAWYYGEAHTFRIQAPKGWNLDTENAYKDGYTAAMCPKGEFYLDAKRAIFIWVFPKDSLTFEQFFISDSAFYARNQDRLIFDRKESSFTRDSAQVVILTTADPGGPYNLAMVAYIDTGTEVVIYELNIDSREDHAPAESAFREALDRFGYVDGGAE